MRKIGNVSGKLLPYSLFFIIAFLITLNQPPNYDTFWHAKVGEWVVENRAFPYVDTFSYFQDLRFMAHEWLFGVVLHWAMSLGGIGIAKLMTATVFFLALSVNLQTLRLRGVNKWIATTSIFFIAILLHGYVQVRPQTFSFLLMSVFLHILERNAASSRAIWHMAAIPLLFVLVANAHGGTLALFIGVFGIYGVTEMVFAIARYRNGVAAKAAFNKTLKMLGVGVASLGASLINPYGFEIYQYAIRIMGNPHTKRIAEWQPYLTIHSDLLDVLIVLTPLLLLLLFRKRLQIRQVFLISLLTGMTFLQRRHFLVLSQFAMVFVTEVAQDAARWFRTKVLTAWNMIVARVAPFRATILATLLVVTLLSTGAQLLVLDGYSETKVEQEMLPVDALAFLRTQNIDIENDRMLAHYNWGGFLIYNDVKVLMDGRTDLYMDSFNPGMTLFEDYMSLSKYTSEEITGFLDKYDVEYILDKPANSLSNYASLSDDWSLLYEDGLCRLYQRRF